MNSRTVKELQTIVIDARSAASGLPLYASQPAAGFPAPGDDLIERPLDLNELLIEHPTSTFFVRVSGDSMEGVGIFDADILVVDRALVPKNGKVVVAAVYGELVVKQLGRHNGQPALLSANPEYNPILVADSDDVFVWGTVVGSVRVF